MDDSANDIEMEDSAEGVCMVKNVMFAPIITTPYKATDDAVIPHR